MSVRHLIGAILVSSTLVFGWEATYDGLIAEADRLRRERRPGDPADEQLNRAYRKLRRTVNTPRPIPTCRPGACPFRR